MSVPDEEFASQNGAWDSDERVDEYDAWYDGPKGKGLFASEVECLRPLLADLPQPQLEVGVGTGRFAEALGIQNGVDPSAGALKTATRRGIATELGAAEALPFAGAAFGGVLLAFTLCFVTHAHRALSEVRRVLKPDGGVVLGLLLKGAPWADSYARRGADGHPLYRNAHFYAQAEVATLLGRSGLHITRCRSTLFQEPGKSEYRFEQAVEGLAPNAGFVGIAAAKSGQPEATGGQ